MKTYIKRKTTISEKDNLIVVCNKKTNLKSYSLSKQEEKFIKSELKNTKEIVKINQYNRLLFIVCPKEDKDCNAHIENCRILGDKVGSQLEDSKSVLVIDTEDQPFITLSIVFKSFIPAA